MLSSAPHLVMMVAMAVSMRLYVLVVPVLTVARARGEQGPGGNTPDRGQGERGVAGPVDKKHNIIRYTLHQSCMNIL